MALQAPTKFLDPGTPVNLIRALSSLRAVKKVAYETAKTAGANEEQASAYADAAHKIDYKAMRSLERRLKIPKETALGVHDHAQVDLRKSPVFWLAPGFSEGSSWFAWAARQPLGKTRRRVMSLARARGMGPKAQEAFYNAFNEVRVNDLANLGRQHGISNASIRRLQQVSKARRGVILANQEMPEDIKVTASSVQFLRRARNIGTPIGVPLAAVVGNGFSRPGLSAMEDLKFGLPGSIIAAAATGTAIVAGSNMGINDGHVQLDGQLESIRPKLKGTVAWGHVDKFGNLAGIEKYPTVKNAVPIDPSLAKAGDLRRYQRWKGRVEARQRFFKKFTPRKVPRR